MSFEITAHNPDLDATGIYPMTVASDNSQDGPSSARVTTGKKCILWVHDEGFSKEEVVLNFDLFRSIQPGDLLAVLPWKTNSCSLDTQKKKTSSKGALSCRRGIMQSISSDHSCSGRKDKHDTECDLDLGNRYLFFAKDMPRTVKSGLEISVAKHIADAFGLKHRSCVFVTMADAKACSASHVELSFKDEYVARSDMWRLTVSELSNKTVYQGQKILFLGSVKAQVTAIYQNGCKIKSAFFSTATEPIFRSGSARYVLFIQMSREMWDFDSEGSGEIMFNKVINGFLPTLFKKWAALNFEHLVSIVLFTRVEYDTGITSCLATDAHGDTYYTGIQPGGGKRPYKDFYRVVVCEMASGFWTTILYQLKREFKFFRRDISMHRYDIMMSESIIAAEKSGSGGALGTRVEAEPSLAIYGNILEAINLAYNQFSCNHIDRDLMRTGHSIVIITPCAGLFEVDYENLKRTTELLVGNGIGINLICLPRIPLHLAPLFRYQNPQHSSFLEALRLKTLPHEDSRHQEQNRFTSSFSSFENSLLSINPLLSHRDLHAKLNSSRIIKIPNEWVYVIPHWLNVSFWTGLSQEINSFRISGKLNIKRLGGMPPCRFTDFAVRCKMYEMEMAGSMESILTEISVIPLRYDPTFLQSTTGTQHHASRIIKRKKPYASLSEFIPRLSKNLLAQQLEQEERKFQRLFHTYDLLKSRVSGERFTLWKKIETGTSLKHGSCGSLRIRPHKELESVERYMRNSSGLFNRTSATFQPSRRGKHRETYNIEEPETLEPGNESFKNNHNTVGIDLRSFHNTKTKIGPKISLGKHGFGIAAPKIAAAEIHPENASATRPALSHKISKIPENKHRTIVTNHLFPKINSSTIKKPEFSRGEKLNKSQSTSGPSTRGVSNSWSTGGIQQAGPLTLKSALESLDSTNQFQSRSVLGSFYEDDERNDESEIGIIQSTWTDNSLRLYNPKLMEGSVPELPTTLPPTPLSPWLTVLNPSNLSMGNSLRSSHHGRWQHIFAELSLTKTMKWKSLCSPASVPLTTENFPTKNQLDLEYQQKPYKISQNVDDDFTEIPKSREGFLGDLIGLRLSQGFQIVVGPAVAEAFGQKSLKIANIFDNNSIAEDGASVFMSMHNVIHQLSCFNDGEVEINIFVRKPSKSGMSNQGLVYNPEKAQSYETRPIILGISKNDYNWNYVDAFLGGFQEEIPDNLRFWRARFVLIPVERPSRIHKHQGEDNDEEVRLEGIKKLTQMWQRHKVFTASEIRTQVFASGKSKDPNPLDIVYKTEDPSIVVTAELETLPLVETGEYGPRKSQLLGTERFQKLKLDIAALAEAIQAPIEKGGVRMQNRRWHLRLHYNCFIGSDMTTWLIDNFEDIETREEAVELGNRLMAKDETIRSIFKDKEKDRGIFVHVERRHLFRDGQYFYQITSEFAKQGLENRSGWFSSKKRDASVPSTPLIERVSRGPSKSELPQSSSNNDDKSSDSGTATPKLSCGGKRPRVYLSKVMKYDIDYRKRSYRPEIINLHYDRLHNPDNCFHIRIDWLNTTAKLIEDEIETWAKIAERHRLRLVEAPIGEACRINSVNPFRSPYRITLIVQPPDQQPSSYLDINSFLPQVQDSLASRHYYQKAILKKFNFVLDIEAAKNFPSDVDVLYSWGKPDYQYSQYIHRSGVLLAQITDDGSFLLLENRIYNNRTAASKEDRYVKLICLDPNNRFGSSHLAGSRTFDSSTPQSIQDNLEALCQNPEALQIFYKEVLDKTSNSFTSSPPPTVKGAHCGSLVESCIPTLKLPPSVLAGDSSNGFMRLNGGYSKQVVIHGLQDNPADRDAELSP